eukprot:TRINITY_DN8672_c0_g1_i12.p1 TRINITY_DN8672_c0_g1~~TRINITY_DN8672_c0_g1_i12.p1  ORF type:complete len:136 (-),score=25.29 TRINITY_DN8672_c0_g1_i12:106-513(-)
MLIRENFFFSSRRRHTRSCLVSWARRCVQETAWGQIKQSSNHEMRQVISLIIIFSLFASYGFAQRCPPYTEYCTTDGNCYAYQGNCPKESSRNPGGYSGHTLCPPYTEYCPTDGKCYAYQGNCPQSRPYLSLIHI